MNGLQLTIAIHTNNCHMTSSDPRISFTDFQLQYSVQKSDSKEYIPFNQKGKDNEQISAFAACKTFLACGTLTGRILIYGYDEETPKAELKMNTQLRVTGLSFNIDGSLLLASCFDRQIWLIDLSDFKIIRTWAHSANILDCAIDPESKSTGALSCVFIDQNNKVIRLKPASALFRSTTSAEAVEISANEFGIEKIVWNGETVAWASSKQFTIMNIKSNQKISQTANSSPYEWIRTSFLFTPNADKMTVYFKGLLYDVDLSPKIIVHPRKSIPQEKNVIIMTRAANLDARLIQQGDTNKEPKIEFKTDGDTIEDLVPYDMFNPNEFLKLVPGPEDVILALPFKVIGIKRATESEIIDVYLNSDRIEACIAKFAEAQRSLSQSERFTLVSKILRHLLAKKDIDRSIKFVADFADTSDWVEIMKIFNSVNLLKAIAKIIPLDNPNLSKDDVTQVLITLVTECSADDFIEKFYKLKPEMYNSSKLINEVSRQAEGETKLNESLMLLQHSLENHQNALKTALEIKHKTFFTNVETFMQYDFVKTNFPQVLRQFPEQLPSFLIKHLDEYPPTPIIKECNALLNEYRNDYSNPAVATIQNFKLEYLDKLYEKKSDIFQQEKYCTELARLYVRTRSPKTMAFLKSTANYDLMDICAEADNAQMYKEEAYLFSTAGSAEKGMEIHLNHIKNAEESLEYAKSCDDKKAWRMISEYAYKDQNYLKCMLADLPNLNIDMVDFIKGIPDHLMPDNFENLIRNSLNEYKRKLRTAQLAYDIVSQDAFGAFKRSFNQFKSGKMTKF